ncbi:MAG TPA: hypothetical protein VIK32_09475 [Candidatus Limnocylindrales bacterium]
MNANPRKPKAAAKDRHQSAEIRSCNYCRGPLPPGSASWRRYCSTLCRQRSWTAANRGPDDDAAAPVIFGKHIRAHFHLVGLVGYLAGHSASAGWFGPGCPPECGGLRPGEKAEPAPPYWRR